MVALSLFKGVDMPFWFRPPTYEENLWTNNALFRYYHQARGFTVIIRTPDLVEQVTYPWNGDIQPDSFMYIYMGGHVAGPLNAEELAILEAHGYGPFISEIPPTVTIPP